MTTPRQDASPDLVRSPRRITPARKGDAELCHRLREGEEAALDALLKSEWRHLVAYAETFTADPDAAEEVAQRVFVRLWRRRRKLDPSRSVRALLYRMTRNLCIDLERKRQTRRQARQRLVRRHRRPPTPHERLRERELRGAIQEAVEGLSPRRREAFMLCRVHGLSHREAADVMGLSPQTVSNHVSAALRHIRTRLAPRIG